MDFSKSLICLIFLISCYQETKSLDSSFEEVFLINSWQNDPEFISDKNSYCQSKVALNQSICQNYDEPPFKVDLNFEFKNSHNNYFWHLFFKKYGIISPNNLSLPRFIKVDNNLHFSFKSPFFWKKKLYLKGILTNQNRDSTFVNFNNLRLKSLECTKKNHTIVLDKKNQKISKRVPPFSLNKFSLEFSSKENEGENCQSRLFKIFYKDKLIWEFLE